MRAKFKIKKRCTHLTVTVINDLLVDFSNMVKSFEFFTVMDGCLSKKKFDL